MHQKYKEMVKGNESISLILARKKLTRNFLLGDKKPSNAGEGVYCRYGRLHFIVSKHNEVVWMSNHNNTSKEWRKDLQLYMELNDRLGIDNEMSPEELYRQDIEYRARRRINRLKWRLRDKTAENGYIKWNEVVQK